MFRISPLAPTPFRKPPASHPAKPRPVDTHYTPLAVAKTLVQAMHDLRPELIADLAAGNGDLLLEAERAWPNANVVATDIDQRATRRLTRLRPTWAVGRCDLRSARSRASCRALKGILRSASLMLLNPPFSCRGGTRFLVETADGPLQASTAMSFLLLAAPYVADHGHIISILPLGCLYSAKDALAWDHLKLRYDVTLLDSYAMGTFPNSTASTAIVRFSPRTQRVAATGPHRPIVSKFEPQFPVRLVRGSCPAHRQRNDSQKPALVHYTDIRNGTVLLNGRRGFGSFACVDGPAIIIPRVGRVTAGKIALYEARHSVMLSDCVIALKPCSLKDAHILRNRLIDNLNQLPAQYIGTGAPFITIARLRAALGTLGVQIDESS